MSRRKGRRPIDEVEGYELHRVGWADRNGKGRGVSKPLNKKDADALERAMKWEHGKEWAVHRRAVRR